MSGQKLWSKAATSTSELVETFTVGRDKEFDVLLAEYDVLGSLAHTQMLESVGLLSKEDRELIHRELNNILDVVRAGRFVIEKDIEDVHSQVEYLLTQRIGEAGKKIHSGRSRNDQVAVDIKLYLRAQVLALKEEAKELFDLLIRLSEQYKDKLLTRLYALADRHAFFLRTLVWRLRRKPGRRPGSAGSGLAGGQ